MLEQTFVKVKSEGDIKQLEKIFTEEVINDEEDAKAREVFLKSGFGRNNLKQALKRSLLASPTPECYISPRTQG